MNSDKKKKNVVFDIALNLNYDEIILNSNLINCIINKTDHVYFKVIKRPHSYEKPFPSISDYVSKRYVITDMEMDRLSYNAYYINKKLVPILLKSPLIISYFNVNDYVYQKSVVCLEDEHNAETLFKKWFKYRYGTNIGLSYVIVFNQLWYEERYEILSDAILAITERVCDLYSEDFATNIKLFKSMWQCLDFDIHDIKLKQEEYSFVFDTFETYYKQAEEIQKQQEQKKE